jgi:hypothetical protein
MTFPFFQSSIISYVYLSSSHCQCSRVYHKQDVSDFEQTTRKERPSTTCLYFTVRLIPEPPVSYRNSSAQILTN